MTRAIREVKETVGVPPAETLRELLDYNPETGMLIWRPRPATTRHDRAWNTRFAGREAGLVDAFGYRKLRLAGQRLFAHRLAWKIIYGDEPPAGVDHINGDKLDNRIANLRPATKSQNGANAKTRRDSSTGVKGVHFNRRRWKFEANVKANGRQYKVGYFDTLDQAKAARDAKARELHGAFFRS